MQQSAIDEPVEIGLALPEEFSRRNTFHVATLPSFITPVTLGVLLFLVVVAIVVLSPSTDSRFIYTDF